MVSEWFQMDFYPTRRVWLFQEGRLWHFLPACVLMQTWSLPGAALPHFQDMVLLLLKSIICSLYPKVSAQNDFIFKQLTIKTHLLTSWSPAEWRGREGKMPFIPALQSWSFWKDSGIWSKANLVSKPQGGFRLNALKGNSYRFGFQLAQKKNKIYVSK